MTRMTLVGTVHAEAGRANVSELVAILERIRPDVIFLEFPAAAFDDGLDGTRANLECAAARRYRDSRQVELVPVDLPTPEAEFFRNNEHLHNRIERSSPEYCRLSDWHSQYVREYGFSYLNSDDCLAHWSALHEAEMVALTALGDPRLVEFHELWRGTIERRDEAMLNAILEYRVQKPFGNGVFLVGAAHRQSIIERVRQVPGSTPNGIRWDCEGVVDVGTRASPRLP